MPPPKPKSAKAAKPTAEPATQIDPGLAVLVEILAEQDAVWIPLRDWRGDRPANTYYGRRMFPTRGIEWFSGERTTAGRKHVERQIKDLEVRKLLTIHRHGGRATHVKLTDAGEDLARSASGLPGRYSSWLSVREVARLSSRRPTTMEKAWVPETKLAGVEWGGKDRSKFVLVEDMLLWGLARGWAVAKSDVQGHVYYRMTDAGYEVADREERQPTDTDASAVGMWELYLERVQETLARLGMGARESGDIGGLPLPVAMHGEPVMPY